MRTNEEAVRHRLSIDKVKRKIGRDRSWDISLADEKQVAQMSTQELAKKLVYSENVVDRYGRPCTIYEWHFDNSSYSSVGKQEVIKACEYWLRKKNTNLLGMV